MRLCCKDHLGEASPFVKALVKAGHEYSPDGPTDLFLIDLDTDKFGYRELIDFYKDCGAVVLQYPHGAPCPTMGYDNLYDPYEKVNGQLTTGQGEIDFMRCIGVERPARPVGWTLCRQFEFRGTETPKRVVFAPNHVNIDGTMDRIRRTANHSIYGQLLQGDWEIVVRHIGTLDQCGLWKDDRVFRYVEGAVDMTTCEIDAADCVVAAAGTYPCLSVARGVPTVMYGQFALSMYGLPNEEPQPLRNLEKYRDLVRYPIDLEEGPLSELIPYACKSAEPIEEWKKAWIGEPFDSDAFVEMIDEWLPELRDSQHKPILASSE